ncbi:MAG: contractile injection system protein, VgrG/Pvc8 family [Lachnospiraceae bacterium]|nr:contractile injection system protein, VgrG/Pvc8 family [Lachnospiraceae bacterium]
MREYHIRTSPVEFLDILELQLEEEINQHGKMILSGHIIDDQEEEYLGLLTGEVWEQVQMIGKDGEIKTLFTGIVTDFAITYINDQRKLTLEMMTGSCLLDRQKHLRTYQDPSIVYEKIFREITAGYAESAITFAKPYAETTGELVLQYEETDWEFLKRLASREHQFLIPDSHRKGTKLFYALPMEEKLSLPEGGKYSLKKDLSEYQRKLYQGMTVSEADCLEYMAECREAHRLGDYTTLYGEKFYIYKISGRYEGGELLYCCYMKKEKGIEVPTMYQMDMAGCSLSAKVMKVKEDKVQVAVLEDENKQQNINIWYPYATVYSTPDGTGWYCMPEPGDSVRLTIPQKQEKDAFVVSSVHVETDSNDRKDPAHKVFKSKYQKEVRFTPDTIVITNNKGSRIELTDEEGIQIISAHSVMLEAAEDMTITSDTGSLLIAGDSFVNLKQKETSIQLEDNISFLGGELKIQ